MSKELNKQEARQAVAGQKVRLVLGISLAIAVIALAVTYFAAT